MKFFAAKILQPTVWNSPLSDWMLLIQAANEWKLIGLLLNIPPGSLDSIEHDSPTVSDALLAVFTAWSKTSCSPYSWKIILKVLTTDIVGHRRLANDIARRLSGEILDCICLILCLTSPLIQCVVCNPVFCGTMLPLQWSFIILTQMVECVWVCKW